MKSLAERIREMNDAMEVESNDSPVDLGSLRVWRFRTILSEEVDELIHAEAAESSEDRLVDLADLLADVVVYCYSEARRWGIPLDLVLEAVMDSQDSKLVDGKAIKDERGKFLKGPNFVPPEPRIREIIRKAAGHDE